MTLWRNDSKDAATVTFTKPDKPFSAKPYKELQLEYYGEGEWTPIYSKPVESWHKWTKRPFVCEYNNGKVSEKLIARQIIQKYVNIGVGRNIMSFPSTLSSIWFAVMVARFCEINHVYTQSGFQSWIKDEYGESPATQTIKGQIQQAVTNGYIVSEPVSRYTHSVKYCLTEAGIEKASSLLEKAYEARS